MYKKDYENILQQLIQAYKTNDLIWFANGKNRYNCKKIIGLWSGMNSTQPRDVYKNAIRKLKHVLKMSRNKQKWEIYLKEKST